MQTRKCHADADANADTIGIRTKNDMPPSPSVGDIMNSVVSNYFSVLPGICVSNFCQSKDSYL